MIAMGCNYVEINLIATLEAVSRSAETYNVNDVHGELRLEK